MPGATCPVPMEVTPRHTPRGRPRHRCGRMGSATAGSFRSDPQQSAHLGGDETGEYFDRLASRPTTTRDFRRRAASRDDPGRALGRHPQGLVGEGEELSTSPAATDAAARGSSRSGCGCRQDGGDPTPSSSKVLHRVTEKPRRPNCWHKPGRFAPGGAMEPEEAGGVDDVGAVGAGSAAGRVRRWAPARLMSVTHEVRDRHLREPAEQGDAGIVDEQVDGRVPA